MLTNISGFIVNIEGFLYSIRFVSALVNLIVIVLNQVKFCRQVHIILHSSIQVKSKRMLLVKCLHILVTSRLQL